jgi:hypothetical protein
MALNSYRQFTTTRTPVNAGAWNPVLLPAGALDGTITLEDATATFRVSANNTFGLAEGVPVSAAGSYIFPGVAATAITVYVNPSAGTVAVVQSQL